MAKCHNKECANTNLKPEELFEEHETGNLFCDDCSVGKTMIMKTNGEEKGLILGRKFDYSASYTREDGLKARARLGGATVSLHVDQSEISRILGPTD